MKPKAVEWSFHAFDVQNKSGWNHQRIAMTGVGQTSAWSKTSKPMTLERKLKLSPLRFSHPLNRINVWTVRWMGLLSTDLLSQTITMVLLKAVFNIYYPNNCAKKMLLFLVVVMHSEMKLICWEYYSTCLPLLDQELPHHSMWIMVLIHVLRIDFSVSYCKI